MEEARGDAGLTAAERLAGISGRFYDALRSPRAREAARGEPVRGDLGGFTGHKYCLVTTFKRSGDPVATPVWFGLADGRLYFRTYADAVKIKRIRNDSRVLVAPCDVRGKPKGKLIEATARVLPSDEEERAERAIQSNYGLFRRIYEGIFAMRVAGTYVEVAPV